MENTEVATDKHLHHIDVIEYSGDGGLIVGSSSLTHRLWTGELSYFSSCTKDAALSDRDIGAQLDCGVSDVKWLGTSQRLVVACDSGAVELWAMSEEKDCLASLFKPVEHDDIVTSVSVNSSATKFVSSGYDKTVVVWDVEEFLPMSDFRAHYDIVWSAAFHTSSPDIFASCSQDGRVLVWDLRQSRPASVMETQFLPSLPTCVSWQPGCDHSLAVATETGHLLLQDCRVGVGTPDVQCVHTRHVNRLAFAPHRSEWLASASQDCTFAVTSFSQHSTDASDSDTSHSSSVILRSTAHADFVQCICWNPVSHELASCSWDGKLLCRAVVSDNGTTEHVKMNDH